MAFQLLVLVLYPTVIAPLFNRFSPLPAGAARERIERLLARCGFTASGLFVMDGSKRSGHGNAYFTGFGRAKRVVFFDTLLARLAPEEIEAVLAHELGHFRLRHVVKRIVWSALLSLAPPRIARVARAGAVVLRRAWHSGRRCRYRHRAARRRARALHAGAAGVHVRAGAAVGRVFATARIRGGRVRRAARIGRWRSSRRLIKLYEDNAATLTPDPLHSAFYDSHPPAAVRVARLNSLAPYGASA